MIAFHSVIFESLVYSLNGSLGSRSGRLNTKLRKKWRGRRRHKDIYSAKRTELKHLHFFVFLRFAYCFVWYLFYLFSSTIRITSPLAFDVKQHLQWDQDHRERPHERRMTRRAQTHASPADSVGGVGWHAGCSSVCSDWVEYEANCFVNHMIVGSLAVVCFTGLYLDLQITCRLRSLESARMLLFPLKVYETFEYLEGKEVCMHRLFVSVLEK